MWMQTTRDYEVLKRVAFYVGCKREPLGKSTSDRCLAGAHRSRYQKDQAATSQSC